MLHFHFQVFIGFGQAGFALAHGFFSPLALRDVAADAGVLRRLDPRIARNGKLAMELCFVTAPDGQLERPPQQTAHADRRILHEGAMIILALFSGNNQFVNLPAQSFVFRITKHGLRASIPFTNCGCLIDRENGVQRSLKNRCFVCFRPPQSFFRLLALGDVSDDFRRSDNLAMTVFDWRDGQRNVDQRSIFPLPHRLEMFGPLSSFEPFQNFRFLTQAVRRDDNRDGLAHYLGGSVAENPFGPLVPSGDDPIQIFADNGVS